MNGPRAETKMDGHAVLLKMCITLYYLSGMFEVCEVQ